MNNSHLEAKNVDKETQSCYNSFLSSHKTDSQILFWIIWDEESGPTLQDNYPPHLLDISFIPIETIGNYLFQASVAIYGYADAIAPQDLLLRIEYVQHDSFIFFDFFEDDEIRGGQCKYLIALISPKISCSDSLELRNILKQISSQIKNGKHPDLKNYWIKISAILNTIK
ncbi:MAG: hypothetical protein ACFFB5_18305 [Promethearchaeota archaeon]